MIAPEAMGMPGGPQVPDVQQKPLRWFLEQALARMFADRMLTPDEMRDIGWFMQSIKMKVAQLQAQGVGGPEQMGQQQQQPFQQQQQPGGPEEPYGSGTGTPMSEDRFA